MTTSNNPTDTTSHAANAVWDRLRRYASLNIEYAKLTAAEKATRLFTVAVLALGLAILGGIMFFFLSMAAVQWIAVSLTLGWAYAIMAAVYLVLIVLALVFRKPLIIDPVARFITRLLFQ